MGSRWDLWNSSIAPPTPATPSPTMSPDSPRLPSSATLERLSQVSTEFSTPVNQRSSFNIYNRGSKSLITEGLHSKDGGTINQDLTQKNKKKIVKGKSVRTFRNLLLCEASSTSSMRTSSEFNNPRSSFEPLLNVSDDVPVHNQAVLIHNKQQEITSHPSIEDSIVSTSGDSDHDEQQSNTADPQPEKRDFHKLISGIRRSKAKMKLEKWRKARSTKLTDRLREKEASIDEWEKAEIARASTDLNEIEHELEKIRLQALEKMHQKISKAQRKAEFKKTKERRSTAKKITTMSRFVDKISVSGKLAWWKSLFNR